MITIYKNIETGLIRWMNTPAEAGLMSLIRLRKNSMICSSWVSPQITLHIP